MACPNDHPLAIDEIEPRSFSFNSPFGACPKCTGLGTELEVDPELLVPDEDLVHPRRRDRAVGPGLGVGRLLPAGDHRPGRGPQVLPRHAVALPARSGPATRCCSGRTTRSTSSTATATAATGPTPPGFEGVVPFVKRRHSETDSDWSRERYEGYMREVPCPECEGARLKPESLAVLLGGRSISAVCALRHRRLREVPAGGRLHRPRAPDRRAGDQGDRGPARLPARRRPGLPLASTAPPARCPVARPSASGWPRRSGPGWSACSTCSTSRPSGCTSATTTG